MATLIKAAGTAGRTAILHIGMPKTGTTTLQMALAAARAGLGEAGLHFARSPGYANHQRLLALIPQGGGPLPTAAAARRLIAAEAPGRLAQDLAAEIEGLPPEVRGVVFSSEHLGGFVGTAAEAAGLRAALAPHFDAFRVVIYIRRQDQYAVSDYSQVLRSGQRRRNPLDARPKDYWEILSCWAEAFGRTAVMPRIYDPAELAGGDVLADFAAILGLPALAPAPGEARANVSLDATAQELLRHLNERNATRDVPEAEAREARQRLLPLLEAASAGPPRLPARAEAEAFVARCAASNEQVRATWFPGRASLFSMDFSGYPKAAPPVPTTEEVLDLALRLLASPPCEAGVAAAAEAAD